jgi:hypothetical protein
MNTENKLTSEELEEIKELNKQYGEIISSLGENEIKTSDTYVKLSDLKKEKESIISEYTSMKIKSEKLHSILLYKYGSGKIDFNTGQVEII